MQDNLTMHPIGPLPDFVTCYDNMFVREFDSMKDFIVFVGRQVADGHKVRTWINDGRTSFKAFVYTNPQTMDTRPFRRG